MAQAEAEAAASVEGALPASENSRRVCCVSCGRVLLEIAVETPEGSRVLVRVKCRDCKSFNLVVLKDGRLNVAVA